MTWFSTTRWIVWLLVLALVGCGAGQRPGIQGSDSVRKLPAVLVSEIRAGNSEGRDVSETFEFANGSGGEELLRLKGKSCSCIDVRVGGQDWAPGEEHRIGAGDAAAVELATQLQPRPGVQAMAALVTVIRADGSEEDVPLRVEVPVVADVEIQPRMLRHEFASPDGKDVVKSVAIARTVRSAQMPTIVAPVIAGQGQAANVLAVQQAGPPSEVEPGLWRLSWTASLQIGNREGLTGTAPARPASVSFEPDGTKATFTLIVRRRFGIDAPKFVELGPVAIGGNRRRSMVIRAADDRQFEVVEIAASPACFEATARAGGARTQHWIDAVFHPGEEGRRTGTIVIRTTHPDSPTVEIEVRGMGQPVMDKERIAQGPTRVLTQPGATVGDAEAGAR